MGQVIAKYTGSALPGNAEVVSIFNSVTAFPGAQMLATLGIKRLIFSVDNDQAGTLKAYKSGNRGTTWTRVLADIAVVAAAANTETVKDFLIEQYADFKLEWTNGATPQTVFNVSVALEDTRNLGF